MAAYVARWVCPATGKRLYRDFSNLNQARKFQELPRPIPVVIEIQRLSEMLEKT